MSENKIDPVQGLHPANGLDAAAILVIHGIGSQRPYETLDAFVQGVARELGIHEGQLEHRLVPTEIGTFSAIRMPLPRPIGRAGARLLDFYEFHWAGMVEGRIKLREVLRWLGRTALTPLRLWAQQATVILHATRPDSKEGSKKSLVSLFIQELTRSVLVLLLAAAIIAPFVYVAAHPDALVRAWTEFTRVVRSPREIGVLCFLAFSVLLTWAAARGGIDLLRKARSGPGTERSAGRAWGIVSVATAGALAIGAFVIDRVFDFRSLEVVGAVVQALRPPEILAPLFALTVASVLGKVLVAYVGDIALYTTADENSAHYRTRSAILKKSTFLLNFLCRTTPYKGVYVAGHSLGSAIAYDTINRYIRDERANGSIDSNGNPEGQDGLARLRGLLTFGSPLDAVYYFFRTEVASNQPIRAQILSSLHGFRKRASGRDYDGFALAPYGMPRLSECHWLNVYSPTDLISRKLVFHEVDQQVRRNYSLGPEKAHMAYWRDKKFYALIGRWL